MIENGLQWRMDVMFRDDECRIRADNASANFATIKHTALNLIRLKSSGRMDSLLRPSLRHPLGRRRPGKSCREVLDSAAWKAGS